MQFASVDKKIKTILVTSSVPGEGKSFVAANLAVAFADSGSKVLLVLLNTKPKAPPIKNCFNIWTLYGMSLIIALSIILTFSIHN